MLEDEITLETQTNELCGRPMIASFRYLPEEKIKVPVLFREKNNSFFMKLPAKPPAEWEFKLIITPPKLNRGMEFAITNNPAATEILWQGTILETLPKEDHCIYQVQLEKTNQLSRDLRKYQRIFTLLPVQVVAENGGWSGEAICLDISEWGMGLQISRNNDLHIGEVCTLAFNSISPDLPKLMCRIVRLGGSYLDNAQTVGAMILPQSELESRVVLQAVAAFVEGQSNDSYQQSPVTKKTKILQANSASPDIFSKLFGLLPREKTITK